MKCLGCGKDDVAELLDLGAQPVCNRFPKSRDEKEFLHRLALGQCTSCGLIQLAGLFPLEEVRLRHDLAVYSEPEDHLDGLAGMLARLPGLDKESRICGISFKDASLVGRMGRLGFEGTRVLDPRKDLGISGRFTGPELIQAAADPERAWKVVQTHGTQDAVIVRHLLEHAYDPRRFMAFVKGILKPDGYVVIEVPDCAQALTQLDYSTVWEEHTVYFTEATFRDFVARLGFSIVDFKRYEYPLEGSLVCIARLGGKEVSQQATGANVSEELKLGRAFSAGFPERRKALSEWLSSAGGNGLAFFGAGHLACVFINIFGMKDKVRLVVDDNPVKKGLFMPGSKIPILGSEALLNEKDGVKLCLLSVNPRNEEKVLQKNRALSGGKMEFHSIFPSSRHALPFMKKGGLRFVSDEVCYASDDIVKVDRMDMGIVLDKALANARKRCRLCAHKGVNDRIHEMLIVHTKGTYVRPHKHINKTESFHVIAGSADVIIFEDNGKVREVISMGEYASGKKFYYRLAEPGYHTLIVRSDVFIFHEVTNGPLVREETLFAPWAPDGNDDGEAGAFLGRLESSISRVPG